MCNGSYGATGWPGVARIWIDGTRITAAIAVANVYYLVNYSNNAKRHVLCQEVGHTFGLDHQQSPRNQSCMNDKWGLDNFSFVSPNQHDIDQLATIDAHRGGDTGDTGDPGGGDVIPG